MPFGVNVHNIVEAFIFSRGLDVAGLENLRWAPSLRQPEG